MIRILASLLVKDGVAVKGRRFASDRVVGDPVAWARVMAQVREVDELVVFDVTRKPADLDLISRIASECFVPLAYGGGIYSVEDAERVVAQGCDKVVLTWPRRDLIAPLASRLGRQAVVACVGDDSENASAMAMLGAAMVLVGAGEVIVQSDERDGEMCGYDLGLVKSISEAVDVPVVASSGAGSYEDMLAAVRAGASGVCAGALWQFTDSTPKGAKQYLRENGVEVRL